MQHGENNEDKRQKKMRTSYHQGSQGRRRQEAERRREARQRREAEDQRRREAEARYEERRPVVEGNYEIERHYQWAIDEAQERDEDVLVLEAFESEENYARAMAVRQRGLNRGYGDSYIRQDPTPLCEHNSGYRSMPYEMAIVVFSLQEAQARAEFMRQQGIKGCRYAKSNSGTWDDCIIEDIPASRQLNRQDYGSPFSSQRAMLYLLMTETAASDYGGRERAQGDIAASGHTRDNWRHNEPDQIPEAYAAASFNRGEVARRRGFIEVFGTEILTYADEYTVPWDTIMTRGLQFRSVGYPNLAVYHQSLIDFFFEPDAHFLDSEMTTYVNIAEFAGLIEPGNYAHGIMAGVFVNRSIEEGRDITNDYANGFNHLAPFLFPSDHHLFTGRPSPCGDETVFFNRYTRSRELSLVDGHINLLAGNSIAGPPSVRDIFPVGRPTGYLQRGIGRRSALHWPLVSEDGSRWDAGVEATEAGLAADI